MLNPNFIHRKSCPICGTTNVTSVLTQSFADELLWAHIKSLWNESRREDWIGVEFVLSYCPDCDFYFTKYVPSEAYESRMLQRFEKTGRTPIREGTMGVEHYSRLAFECERIASLIGKRPDEISVLEFGSGFGHWLLMAKAFNFMAVGVEIYEDRAVYAEKNALSICRSLNEVGDESQDFIFSNQVFEHLNEPLSILSAVVKKLKRGGMMQIGVPQGNIIPRVLSDYTGTPHKVIGPIGHINGFSNYSLVKLAKCAGLSLLPVSLIRKQYTKTMMKNRNLRYIYDIALAGYKQKKSCYLYFQKP